MTTTQDDMIDIENPSVKRKKVLGVINNDPVAPTIFTSMVTNIFLSNVFLYGFTGNLRLALLVSLFSVPISINSCLKDAENDFEKWQKLSKLREKGIPERFYPYKCKYDWTGYEDEMKFVIEKKANNKK